MKTIKYLVLSMTALFFYSCDKLGESNVDKETEGIDSNFSCVEPLNYYVSNEDLKGVSCAIDAGADINAQDDEGITPIALSVEIEDSTIFDYLIKKGAKIDNVKSKYGSLLHTAVANNNLKAVKYLLKKENVFINALNEDGKTPAHLAVEMNHLNMLKCLLEYGLNIANEIGGDEGDKSRVELYKDTEGNTILHLAVKKGYYEIVKYLLKYVKNERVFNWRNKRRDTPLNLAIKGGYLDLASLLIDAGTNMNIVDSRGETSIFIAVETGDLEMVKLLVENGVRLDTTNIFAKTVLQVAYDLTYNEIANYLEEHGALG